jgi:hypothetical protein
MLVKVLVAYSNITAIIVCTAKLFSTQALAYLLTHGQSGKMPNGVENKTLLSPSDSAGVK